MMNSCLFGCKPLRAADRELVEQYLTLVDYRLSRYNFINLWMYGDWLPVYYALKNEIMVLLTFYKEHYFADMPLCRKEKINEAFDMIEAIFAEEKQPFVYAGFEEAMADEILKRHPDFEKRPYRDSFDYIYQLERFRNFTGKRLQKKRNHLNAFYRLYPDFEYRDIEAVDGEELRLFVEDWYSTRSGELLAYDKVGNLEVLANYDKLNACGGCLLIDGKISAFIIASLQGQDTMQVNIEKANESYRGIYQALLREFLRYHFKDAIYMNREDDLGLDNLRHAKLSYSPDLLLANYRICEKDYHAGY